MSGQRVPGPTGTWGICTLDGGTLVRSYSLPPGSIGDDENISDLPLDDRFKRVLELTGPRLPGEIQEEFTNMLTPYTVGIMVGVLAAWAVSHYFGIGLIADAILLIGGFALLGWQVISAAKHLKEAIEITYYAKRRSELDAASRHLAEFIAVVGVAIFMALLMKGAKGAKGKVTSTIGLSASVMARRAGMALKHFEAFKAVAAAKGGLNRIIAVRYTNPKSVKWIEMGFPGKPMKLKANTDDVTGIVTVKPNETNPEKTAEAVWKAGYYIIDELGIARNAAGKKLDLPAPEWPVKPGQVIDPAMKKPVVGDYDLLAVIDPKATGRNIALAVDDGVAVANRSNPDIAKVQSALNGRMDQPRVMHGTHDSFGDLPSAISKPSDGAIIFHPNGKVQLLETLADVEAFYAMIGRQTIKGSYPRPTPSVRPGGNVIPFPGRKL